MQATVSGTWLLLALTVAVPVAAVEESASGRFLVAEASLQDPNFKQTVVLIVQHDAEGALGLVVNRPLELAAAELLPEIDGLERGERALHWGGPVGERGVTVLVRTSEALEGSDAVLDEVRFGWDGELLRRLAGDDPVRTPFLLFAGYAGWSPGQLDRELDGGAWRVIDADADDLFTGDPRTLWKRLARPDPHLRASIAPVAVGPLEAAPLVGE